MSADAVFRRVAVDRFEPTEYARGPWDPRAMHGGAPAALVAGVLEAALAAAAPGDRALHPARLTIDLERPVGIEPLSVRAEIVRSGRKVRIAEVEVIDPRGNRVVRASLLGIRRTPDDLDLGAAVQATAVPPPPVPTEPVGPSEPPFARTVDGPMFHSHAVEHRFVQGSLGALGPGTDWIRLAVPVVADEPITALQRVAAAADFGNGVSAALPFGWVFINPDLTVTLARLPVGEWVCLDSVTQLGPDGTGLAESELWDETGRLGRSIQTLLVEPPP